MLGRYGYAIPKTVQLYWHCDHCNKAHKWPETKASLYCNRKCTNAHYYKLKINK